MWFHSRVVRIDTLAPGRSSFNSVNDPDRHFDQNRLAFDVRVEPPRRRLSRLREIRDLRVRVIRAEPDRTKSLEVRVSSDKIPHGFFSLTSKHLLLGLSSGPHVLLTEESERVCLVALIPDSISHFLLGVSQESSFERGPREKIREISRKKNSEEETWVRP